MVSIDAEGLIQQFSSSQEFFQICIEIKRRLVTHSLERDWLYQRLTCWLTQRCEQTFSHAQRQQLIPLMYVAAMEAIANRSYMVESDDEEEAASEKESDVSLFPEIDVTTEGPLSTSDALRQALLQRIHAQRAQRTASPGESSQRTAPAEHLQRATPAEAPRPAASSSTSLTAALCPSEPAGHDTASDDPWKLTSAADDPLNGASTQDSLSAVVAPITSFSFQDLSLPPAPKQEDATSLSASIPEEEVLPPAPKQEDATSLSASTSEDMGLWGEEEGGERLPSHHSLPAIMASRSQHNLRALPRQDDEDVLVESGSQRSMVSLASMMQNTRRFQSIVFDKGFYLVDRETGQAWFVKAGSQEMVPCHLLGGEGRLWTKEPGELLLEGEASQEDNAAATPYRPVPREEGFASSHAVTLGSHLPRAGGALVPQHPGGMAQPPLTPLSHLGSDSSSGSSDPYMLDLAGLDPWHSAVLERYPYPIAYLYRAYLAEQDPRLRLRLLVLVFHQTLKLSIIPLVLQFLREPHLNDLATYQALSRMQSSSWVAWLDFLRSAAGWMDDMANPISRRVLESFRRLETDRPLEERFLYTQRFLDPMGEERVTYLQLGLLEAMVLFRDSFVHGFTPTVKQAEEDLRVYEPLLCEILQELSWLQESKLYYTYQCVGGQHQAIPLMGWRPEANEIRPIPEDRLPVGRPSLFLLDEVHGSTLLPLFPLVIADTPTLQEPTLPHQKHALYLFDGCSGKQLIYHNLWHTPTLREEGMVWWRERLSEKRFSPPMRELSPASMLRQTSRWTLSQMEQLLLQQKYFPELVVERSGVERWLHDFLASEFQLFLLHGSAGSGKTTLLAQLAQQLLAKEHPVIWLRGVTLLSQGVMEALARVIGFSLDRGLPRPDGLARYLFGALSEDKPLLIILDDLEPSPRFHLVMEQVDRLVAALAQTSLHDRIKFVVSLQSDALWQMQQESSFFPESRGLAITFEDSHLQIRPPSIVCELPPLTQEEVAWAFARYSSYDNGHGIAPFCPQTAWDELPYDSTRALMRIPHVLRLVTATFCGQDIPGHLELSHLMEHLSAYVIEERYAPLPIPERLQFLRAFAQMLLHSEGTSLTREQLLQSNNPLVLRALQNPHSDSPLVQLLHLGILSEDWCGAECSLQFSSSLVRSFFLARAWMEEAAQRDPSLLMPEPHQQRLPVALSRTYPYVWMHLLESGQMPSFSSWMHEHFAVLDSWLEEFLLLAARTGSRFWRMLVTELLVDASEPLFQCLLRVSDRLCSSQDEAEASELLEILAQQNKKLRSVERLHSEILYRQARLCEAQQRRDEAIQLLREAEASAEAFHNRPMLAQIYVRLSSLARTEKQLDEAMAWLEQAQEQLEEGTFPRRLARVVRQQGNLAYEKGDLSQALASYQQSLRIDESCGNFRGMAASLSNLGTVFGARGDFKNALGHYFRCLHIHQKLGDRRNVATTLNNIGIIHKSQKKWDNAIEVFVQALALRRELGLLRESVASLQHMAVIWEQLGNMERALEALDECRGLLLKLGNEVAVAEVMLRMGHLLMRRGQLDEATNQLEALVYTDPEVVGQRFHAEAWYALGQLRWRQGALDASLLAFEKAERLLVDSESLGLRAAVARCLAVALAERGQWQKAECKLEEALQWAEDSFQPQERLDCMVEWAHLCLLREHNDAAQALTDRVASLQEDIPSALNRKDLLALKLRLATRHPSQEHVAEHLQVLQSGLDALDVDDSPLRTAWALYEAALFFRDRDSALTQTLAIQADQLAASRPFSPRSDLRELIQSLPYSVPSPLPLSYDADTHASLDAALAVPPVDEGNPAP